MGAKTEKGTGTHILVGDTWTSRHEPRTEVIIIEQNDRLVTFARNLIKVKCKRDEFLAMFELCRRTKRWSPADTGRPR